MPTVTAKTLKEALDSDIERYKIPTWDNESSMSHLMRLNPDKYFSKTTYETFDTTLNANQHRELFTLRLINQIMGQPGYVYSTHAWSSHLGWNIKVVMLHVHHREPDFPQDLVT